MRARKILERKLTRCTGSIHKARFNALLDVVCALLVSGALSSSRLGRAIGGRVAAKHNIKKVDRLLGNTKLVGELPLIYKSIASHVITHEQLVVLVDWTDLGDGFAALAAGTPIGGRSLVLYQEVHPKTSWHSAKVHREFLVTLRSILFEDTQPIIVTDAGFRASWFKAVRAMGWDFVGNVHGLSRMKLDHQWVQIPDLADLARYKPKQLGPALFTKKHQVDVHLTLYKPRSKGRKVKRQHKRRGTVMSAVKNATKPCVLATSLDWSAKRIQQLYRMRMQIEETFRDTKSERFGWSLGQTRAKNVGRWSVLLVLAALGMFVVTVIGRAAEAAGLDRREKANTVARKTLSTFMLGWTLIWRDNYMPSALEIRTSMTSLRQALP